MNTTTPKVSVSLITYNQEKYVRQALDSILMQQVNFDYEVIVGDDCSPDNTRAIIKEYRAKHPDKIKTIFHQEKPGGIPGKINFVSTIHEAKGEYVAMLDGDDYWTDPLKLQRQVDFLDSHPEYSLCFHNSRLVFEGVEGKDRNYNTEKTFTRFEIDDLILKSWFIHSGSIMYRREWFPRVKDSFYALPSGDIPLGITLAAQGPVGYLPEVMSVYRKNANSITNSGHPHRFIKALEARIQILRTLNEDLNMEFEPIFQKAISSYQLQIAKYLLRAGESGDFLRSMNQVQEIKSGFDSRDQQLYRILSIFKKSPFLQGLVPFFLKLRAKLSRDYQYS